MVCNNNLKKYIKILFSVAEINNRNIKTTIYLRILWVRNSNDKHFIALHV